MNKLVSFGLATGLVSGMAVGTLATGPVAAATVAAPTLTTKAAVLTAKKKPAFYSKDARLGVAKSASVRNLQRALIKKRYANKSLRKAGATGNYLAATRTSVSKAQRKMGFRGAAADGILGKTSAARLGLRWLPSATKAVAAKPAAPKLVTPAPVASPANPIRVATYPGGRGLLGGASLKSTILQAGFTGTAVCQAWGIAMRESGGYPGIMGPMNSNKTYDHGLFQINDVHRANISFGSIYSGLYNAKYAYTLSNRGTNFSHWGLGDSGWAGTLKKQNKAYWQMLQDRAAQYTVQCNKF